MLSPNVATGPDFWSIQIVLKSLRQFSIECRSETKTKTKVIAWNDCFRHAIINCSEKCKF